MKIIHIATAMSLIIMGSCNTNAQVIEQNLTLNTVVKGVYFLSNDTGKHYILVDVMLQNKSTSSFSFFAYSCDTSISLVLDSKQATISSHKCGGNSSVLLEIPALKTLVFPIIIETPKNSDAFINPIKVGLVLLQTNDGTAVMNQIYRKKERNEDIIWSAPFYLNDFGQPYAIY